MSESTGVMAAFKKRLIRQIALTATVLPAFIIVAFARRGQTIFEIPGLDDVQLLIGAGAMAVVGIGLSFANWRCPGCKAYLGKTFYPKFCGGCGVQLHP